MWRIVSSGATTGRIQWSIVPCGDLLYSSREIFVTFIRRAPTTQQFRFSLRNFGRKFSQVSTLTLTSALLDLKNRARGRKYLQFLFFGAQTNFFSVTSLLARKKEDILSGIVDHTVLERKAKMRKPFYNHPVGRALFFQRYSFFFTFLLSLQELTSVTLSFGSLCFTLYIF